MLICSNMDISLVSYLETILGWNTDDLYRYNRTTVEMTRLVMGPKYSKILNIFGYTIINKILLEKFSKSDPVTIKSG